MNVSFTAISDDKNSEPESQYPLKFAKITEHKQNELFHSVGEGKRHIRGTQPQQTSFEALGKSIEIDNHGSPKSGSLIYGK